MHIKAFAKWFFYPSYLDIYTPFFSSDFNLFRKKFNMLPDSNAGPPDPLAKAVRKQFDEEIRKEFAFLLIIPQLGSCSKSLNCLPERRVGCWKSTGTRCLGWKQGRDQTR